MAEKIEIDENRLMQACPVCRGHSNAKFVKNGHDIRQCVNCDHRFAATKVGPNHLAQVYGDKYFFDGGDGYDDYLANEELLRIQGRRYGQILSKHLTPGRLLDVGSAAGFLQAGLEDVGWLTTGLEPNKTMVEHAQISTGVNAIVGSLEDLERAEVFDAVCLIQVVGHFNDLSKAMQSLSRVTRDGGLCLVEYWRRDSFVARVLGAHWHEYSPPSVLHWYTRTGLDDVFTRNGFRPVDRGAPKKFILGRHAKSLLIHKLSELPGGSFLAPVIRALPLPKLMRYPAFDLEWRLYRRET